MEFIKEFVREEVKTRNGKRVLEVVGALYARLAMDGTLLISYVKLNRQRDNADKDFENNVLFQRAMAWKSRLAEDQVIFTGGQIVLVRPGVLIKGVAKVKRIPYLISQALPHFINRALKYYQGAPLVGWAAKVLQLSLPTFPLDI